MAVNNYDEDIRKKSTYANNPYSRGTVAALERNNNPLIQPEQMEKKPAPYEDSNLMGLDENQVRQSSSLIQPDRNVGTAGFGRTAGIDRMGTYYDIPDYTNPEVGILREQPVDSPFGNGLYSEAQDWRNNLIGLDGRKPDVIGANVGGYAGTGGLGADFGGFGAGAGAAIGANVGTPAGAKGLNEDEVKQSSSIIQPEQQGYKPQQLAGPGENQVKTTSEVFGDEDPEDPNSNATEQGNIYDQNVLNDLTGKSADVESARNEANRDSRYQTYADEKSIKESLASEGIMPGTAGYQRMLDKYRVGTNQANLSRTNNVNQLQRDVRNDAMNRAEGVEAKHYGRDQYLEERDYGRSEGKRLETKTELSTFISRQDPKIRNILEPYLISGDIEGANAAIAEMYQNGTLKEDYRPADTYQTLMDESASYYEQLSPKGDMTDEQWRSQMGDWDNDENTPDNSLGEAITDRYQQLEIEREPLNDAEDQTQEKEASKTRIGSAIESGDYSGLTEGDWTGMTDSERVELQKSASDFKTENNQWGDLDNMSDSSAQNTYWKSTGSLKKGQAVNKGGVTYIITEPAKVYGAGGDNKRIGTWAINTKTGKEEKINWSPKFENSLLGDKVTSTPVDENGENIY